MISSSTLGPNLAKDYNEEWVYEGKNFESELLSISTDAEEVAILIKGIDTNKSSCIDMVSSRALKDGMSAIPGKIADMFNASLTEKCVPSAWKIGTIIPLQKDGDKTDVANLRPITLLPIIGKMLEKIVNNRLMSYLEENSILDKKQGGFRSGHSTASTIAYYTNEVYRGLNDRYFTLSTFVDLKKAFDTVNHSILLKKLSKLGVGGPLYEWLVSYLSERKQKTFVNGKTSKEGIVKCGVPQGSILGPTLFLIYINDLSQVLENCNAYLYADDTVVSISGFHLHILTRKMEYDLKILDVWFKRNRLTLNAKKTNYMIFGLRPRLKEIIQHTLYFGDKKIDRSHSLKYLGVVLDPVLNFNKHAETVIKKVIHKVYLLARLREFMDNKTLLKMYKTMVLPYADYGDIFYDSARQALLDKLQIVQNKALRICMGVDNRFPTILVHQNSGISKLQPRRLMHLKTFMFKQKANIEIINVREVHTRAHDAVLFLSIKPKNETTKKSALYRGAIIWNMLSVELRNTVSYEEFKLSQKRWLSATNYM